MKRLIVTGAGGFLGSHIVRKALETGAAEILAVSTKPNPDARVTSVETDRFLAGELACGAEDILINCLFPTNADGYRMADGLDKVCRILSAARTSGVGAMINISSQSVYASKRTAPAREEDPLCLETPYAVGKYLSERMTAREFEDRPHTSIRMASLLGPGYRQRIVNRMAAQALRGETLTVIGGMQRYGFLDVRDAAAALVRLALSEPSAWREVYNLGRNESYSLLDVLACLQAEIRAETGSEAACEIREGEDLRNSSLDASRFMEQFAWRPELSLAQTTRDIVRGLLKEMESGRI